jgi:hypothetical protein
MEKLSQHAETLGLMRADPALKNRKKMVKKDDHFCPSGLVMHKM